MIDDNISVRVINEVAQIIEDLSIERKKQIPENILNFYINGAKEKEKYKVDKNIPIDKQDLDKETYNHVAMILSYIKREYEYVEINPSWTTYSKKSEQIEKLEEEISLNLYNINNILADRRLAKVEYVLDFEYSGRCFKEENIKRLKPFVALCRIFSIVHKEYLLKGDEDKTLQMYIFITEELKKNIDLVF